MRCLISSTSGSPCRMAADRAGLDRARRAAVGVLGHRADLVGDARGMRQPADAPAGHRPGLREAVDGQHPVAVLGDLQDGGRHDAVEIEPAVDLVRDDPDAGAPAEIEQGAASPRASPSSRSGWTGSTGRWRACGHRRSRTAGRDRAASRRRSRARRGAARRRSGGWRCGCSAIAARRRRRWCRYRPAARARSRAPACRPA